MNQSNAKEKVLLTGGSGFIAWHVLNTLLDHGPSSFAVVITVRSADVGDRVIQCLHESSQPSVSYEIVDDVAKQGAFDHVFKAGHHAFTYVVHTASPYSFSIADPVNDFLHPAIHGTTNLLATIHAFAPSVRRVVLTSSSAAIVNPLQHEAVYDESHWSPFTWEDAIARPEFAYATSKKLAEQAAWAFLTTHTPTFTLSTINNTYTFGPIPPHLPAPATAAVAAAAINASNQRILHALLLPGRRLGPTLPTFTWVDVRDVALAHVRAMLVPAAAGLRFFVVAGYSSNQRLARLVRFERQLQGDGVMVEEEDHDHDHDGEAVAAGDLEEEEEEEDDFPGEGKVFGFSNARSRSLLGLQYRGLEESVRDTVASILEWQRGI